MKNEHYILSIDQGTTSCRAIIFDKNCNVCGLAQREFTQYFPQEGWVEHDAIEIWETQLEVIKEVLSKTGISAHQLTTAGITNQRETTVVWNKTTGKPIHHAIVWQDRRTSEFCESLRTKWHKKIKSKTGLIIDAYFSASKIKWILDNVPGARNLADDGQLLFGTIETWLIWNLTGRKSHVTDISNASRTMLFNIVTQKWDNKLIELFDIPRKMLPRVLENMDDFGRFDPALFDKALVPIYGAAGDQQSALFGQLCHSKGSAKNTYGTGCFMVANTGDEIVDSKNKLLSTVAWKINGQITYALEGSVFVAGAIIQWLRDSLGLISKSSESEAMAMSVENNGGVYLVPALTGLGAPYWDQDARGIITGLTRGTTKSHVVRAALEGIAYQVSDVITAMSADLGTDMEHLKVDGGATSNQFLMQFQASISNIPVVVAANQESTALGAALLAGLKAGIWKNIDEVKTEMKVGKTYPPDSMKIDRVKLSSEWKSAVKRCRSNR